MGAGAGGRKEQIALMNVDSEEAHSGEPGAPGAESTTARPLYPFRPTQLIQSN